VRGLKVAASDLPDYIERVVRRYTAERTGSETFSTWAAAADEEALR
jgi:sulfite reductase (ferredoxin)